MIEQVRQVLVTVAARHADKRLHVFDVQPALDDDGVIRLTGRVLDAAGLQSLRRALGDQVRDVRIDDSGIKVLRRHPPTVFAVATNLANLHTAPEFLSEVATQVTNGYPLEVLDESGNWCFVRQPDGYLGWISKTYLAAERPIEATHLVASPSTWIYRDARRDSELLTRLAVGTAIGVVEQRGDWVRVQPVGEMLPGGWIAISHLRSMSLLPLPPAEARRQMITDARRLFGVYYVWGGCTAFGIDCSGLCQLVHRLAGYAIPRDTTLQFPAGRTIDPPFEAGDLLFFHANVDRNKISHVGLSTGGLKMIHSSRRRNGVYEEDVEAVDSLRKTFAGARSFIAVD